MNQLSHPDSTQLESWEIVLLRAAHQMSLSKSQYKLIADRYAVLQDILSAATDPLLRDAHIFVQGSIRLKTTLKPAPEATDDMATIDADAVVWLPNASVTDSAAVLKAIETRFREGVRVEAPIESLRRGIRIVYADENPGFHIDITPARCAPGNGHEKGEGKLQVPDREMGWKASSPIPYAQWLELAAEQEIQLTGREELFKRHVVMDLAEATQDPLPDYDAYIDGNPLRAAIKLLKRHRDEWAIRMGKESVRPISAVITTLAAQAYAEIALESQQRSYRPIEAIMEIVARMPKFIQREGNACFVCNPKDSGENFAEKWNRPGGEGEAYRRAFDGWHTAALQDIRMGLRDFGSTKAFVAAMNESFGVSNMLVEDAVRELPGHWNLPGRAPGLTANAARLSALVGGSAASHQSQASIKPVDRLG
jgi:hypothetical protein